MNEISEIEKLFVICDQESRELVDIKNTSYEIFKKQFILFLHLLYDKLKESEQHELLRANYSIGETVVSFGTDEFIYEYDDFAKILSGIDRARKIESNPDKYQNKLVKFRDMFNSFFKCLDQPVGSIEALKIFEELVKRCLAKLGFDHVNAQLFCGNIIFRIDVCSRLAKLMEQFYREQREYKNAHPEFLSVYVNNIDTYIDYLRPKLENWDIFLDDVDKRNPSSIVKK